MFSQAWRSSSLAFKISGPWPPMKGIPPPRSSRPQTSSAACRATAARAGHDDGASISEAPGDAETNSRVRS
eukprot:4467595-Pyramimonas_sp.AAC.1